MTNASDFVIENGALKKYVGPGGDVIIPEGVKRIDKRAFAGCKNLESIIFPKGEMRIMDEVFLDCENLKNVVFQEGLMTIWDKAFRGCTSLENIIIPKGVTFIGDEAFHSCTSLVRISLPNGLHKLQHNTFYGCNALKEIYIADPYLLPPDYRYIATVSFIEEGAPHDDPRYAIYNKVIKSNAEKWMAHAIASPALLSLMCQNKLIPAKIAPDYLQAAQADGNTESIAMMMEYSAIKLSTKEKKQAANKKESDSDTVLERRIMREGQRNINGLVFAVSGTLYTFANQNELKAFITKRGGKLASAISAKVDYLIMNNHSTDSEKKQTAEKLGIDVITERQFNDKSGRAFEKDSTGALTKYRGAEKDVVIPKGVTSIGYRAFALCESIERVTIPMSVTAIGSSAFRRCENLENIVISKGVTMICDSAFRECKKLETIIIPEGVTHLCDFAFAECQSLEHVIISEETARIGMWVFSRCSNLKSIRIPESVTSIGENAFYNCRNLSIHGAAGSFAETYAKENNIPFVAE